MKPSLSLILATFLVAGCASLPEQAPRAARPLGNPAPVVAAQAVIPTKGITTSPPPEIKVALLLPLSGESVAIGNAMLDAATMALYDSYFATPSNDIHSQVVLLPKDTGNTPADAVKAAQQAVAEGATFMVGPLFSQSVTAIAPIAKEHHIGVLTFSNTLTAAQPGIYVFGFLPEQQVDAIAEYAYLHKLLRIAILAPNDNYGQKVNETLIQAYEKRGGIVAPSELYAPSNANIGAAVSRLAATYNGAPEDRRFQAIFIAEGGARLRTILEELKKNNIDLKKVRLLGTGLWDDPEIANIPEMNGAWFPSSTPGPYQVFEKRYVASYGHKPARLASLSYDAISLIAALTMPSAATGVNIDALTDPHGFDSPANGLVRIKADGTSERKLAIMEVTPGGFKVIDQAAKSF